MSKLLRATDLNFKPVMVNTDRIVMIGTNAEGKTVIQTDVPTPAGMMGILVTNSPEDLAEKIA